MALEALKMQWRGWVEAVKVTEIEQVEEWRHQSSEDDNPSKYSHHAIFVCCEISKSKSLALLE